jgi:hypothetical protein
MEAAFCRALRTTGRDAEQLDIERVADTAGRRERYRARLRVASPPPTNWVAVPAPHLEAFVHARTVLLAVRRATSRIQWRMLLGIAGGRSYADLAGASQTTPATLRVRVLRLRRRLAEPFWQESRTNVHRAKATRPGAVGSLEQGVDLLNAHRCPPFRSAKFVCALSIYQQRLRAKNKLSRKNHKQLPANR